MSTSLQRAAASKPKGNGSSSLLISPKKGAFEACFAQGLDLSEFASDKKNNDTTPQPQQQSAAAELLQLKQNESQQRAIQEQEDANLAQLAQQRAQSLQALVQQPTHERTQRAIQAALDSSVPPSNARDRSNFMGNLVVQLHGADEQQEKYGGKKKKKKKMAKNGISLAAARSKSKHLTNKNSKNNNSKGNYNISNKLKHAIKAKSSSRRKY